MKRSVISTLLFWALLAGACSPSISSTPTIVPTNIPTKLPATIPANDTPTVTPGETPVSFVLSSPAFANGETIPTVYSCRGESKSPALTWSEPPAGTQTFALIVDDPDANGYTHWVIYNIPADYRGLPENVEHGQKLEKGIYQGLSGGAVFGYVGPCPPSGKHHYSFRLYALDVVLKKGDGVGKALLQKAVQGHTLAESELIGVYPP